MQLPRLPHHSGKRLCINDFIFAMLLLYLTADMYRNWETFHSCSQPIREWLLGTYVLVAFLRIVRLNAPVPPPLSRFEEFDYILPHGHLGNLCWLVLTLWTATGTLWTIEGSAQSKLCFVAINQRHYFRVLAWLVLSYTWLIFHAWVCYLGWQRKLHLRRDQDNLRAVEDDDVRSRWGNVSQRFTDVPVNTPSQGLTAKEIAEHPSKTVEISEGYDDCPICLSAFRPGDSVRPLASCGHTFHRACIDLWLLRRADCPLCKVRIGEKCNFGV